MKKLSLRRNFGITVDSDLKGCLDSFIAVNGSKVIASGYWKDIRNGRVIEGYKLDSNPSFIHTLEGVYDDYYFVEFLGDQSLN
jgi:hypothetical protein